MATKTGTAVGRIRELHAGLNCVIATYVAGGDTLSAGDVIQMLSIPNGAIIADVIVGGNSGNTGITVDVGDGGSAARFINNASLSVDVVVVHMTETGGLGYRYSLTDGAIPLADTIDITIVATATATNTATLVLAVMFYMPPIN